MSTKPITVDSSGSTKVTEPNPSQPSSPKVTAPEDPLTDPNTRLLVTPDDPKAKSVSGSFPKAHDGDTLLVPQPDPLDPLKKGMAGPPSPGLAAGIKVAAAPSPQAPLQGHIPADHAATSISLPDLVHDTVPIDLPPIPTDVSISMSTVGSSASTTDFYTVRSGLSGGTQPSVRHLRSDARRYLRDLGFNIRTDKAFFKDNAFCSLADCLKYGMFPFHSYSTVDLDLSLRLVVGIVIIMSTSDWYSDNPDALRASTIRLPDLRGNGVRVDAFAAGLDPILAGLLHMSMDPTYQSSSTPAYVLYLKIYGRYQPSTPSPVLQRPRFLLLLLVILPIWEKGGDTHFLMLFQAWLFQLLWSLLQLRVLHTPPLRPP